MHEESWFAAAAVLTRWQSSGMAERLPRESAARDLAGLKRMEASSPWQDRPIQVRPAAQTCEFGAT